MKVANTTTAGAKITRTKTPPVVLTIAGFDPSSGAGVTADIKTIAANGCYGVACVTALTVQSTSGVRRIEPVDTTVLTDSLKVLADDLELSAVHVGMLGSGLVATAVADFLAAYKTRHVIVDPILKASSGANLIDKKGLKVMKERILPLATVITPNVDEAAALSGLSVTDLSEMRACARFLHSSGVQAMVITGGHLKNATDLLSVSSKGQIQQQMFPSRHIKSRSTHGTGCAFATALACQLALGRELPQAVLAAKVYVREAIAKAYPVGRGVGPINHFATFRAKGRR